MTLNKQYIIAGGIAAAVLVSILVFSDTVFSDESDVSPNISEDIQSDSVVELTPIPQPVADSQLSTYRIDDTCELLYSMTHNVYPNDEPLQRITMSEIVDQNPEQFSQWTEIFSNQGQLELFAQQGFSIEFFDAFSTAVMQEYSISPELQPIVVMALDQSLALKVDSIFNENNCFGYFESRQNGS